MPVTTRSTNKSLSSSPSSTVTAVNRRKSNSHKNKRKAPPAAEHSDDETKDNTDANPTNPTNPPASSIIVVRDKRYRFGLYTGDWDPDTEQPHGQGLWSKDDVVRYIGAWVQGKWTGVGTTYDEDGLRVCTGPYLDGETHGFVTRYEEDGETIESAVYHIHGEEFPEIKNEKQFQKKVKQVEKEQQKKAKLLEASNSAAPRTISFSFSVSSSSPIMSAPIIGLFPRYEHIPMKMLNGAGFDQLEDDEIPTPTNLEEGKSRADWINWVRQNYPKREE